MAQDILLPGGQRLRQRRVIYSVAGDPEVVHLQPTRLTAAPWCKALARLCTIIPTAHGHGHLNCLGFFSFAIEIFRVSSRQVFASTTVRMLVCTRSPHLHTVTTSIGCYSEVMCTIQVDLHVHTEINNYPLLDNHMEGHVW